MSLRSGTMASGQAARPSSKNLAGSDKRSVASLRKASPTAESSADNESGRGKRSPRMAWSSIEVCKEKVVQCGFLTATPSCVGSFLSDFSPTSSIAESCDPIRSRLPSACSCRSAWENKLRSSSRRQSWLPRKCLAKSSSISSAFPSSRPCQCVSHPFRGLLNIVLAELLAIEAIR